MSARDDMTDPACPQFGFHICGKLVSELHSFTLHIQIETNIQFVQKLLLENHIDVVSLWQIYIAPANHSSMDIEVMS